MAKSGRIALSVNSTNDISGYIDWVESDVSIEQNTSVVTASLVYVHNGSVLTGNDASDFYLSVNGSRVEKRDGYIMQPGNTYTVLRNSVTVKHNDDGSKYITIEGGGGITDTIGLSGSRGSATVELTAINRVVRVNAAGTWKRAIPYVKSSGVWKQALPYVRSGGAWEIGT